MNDTDFRLGELEINSVSCNRVLYHQENMTMKSIPLKPHFYIEKMGFAGVFLFLLQNIDSCGHLPQSMF